MINNFIGGGQVFLHKVRMLRQVVGTTIIVSLIAGFFLCWSFSSSSTTKFDLDGATTYVKAKIALSVHPALSKISIGKSQANVDAYSEGRLWKKRMLASSVISSYRFKSAWDGAIGTLYSLIIKSLALGSCAGVLVFLLWSKFGRSLKEEKRNEGSGVVLTDRQVKRKLKQLGLCSEFYIGNMPLVKNMETRHFLVTGSTGSGKTNLLHNLLPQIENKGHPAIVIDQTGEMIAKYYNPERGDIIFNPFDARGVAWDFWADCSTREDLERFSKILISFNRKQSGSNSDPFWENAAESVFIACVEYLRPRNASIKDIVNMTCYADIAYLQTVLLGTEASRYIGEDSKQTSSSIASVLASNAKPLSYLPEVKGNYSFSMKEHFSAIKQGSNAWLFLSTKPSSRALTLPLIACLTELALAQLMEIGINKNRRVWTIIDELPALGLLPALSPLMAEGRKYGACVIACMQSLNQLFDQYGQYAGSSIFGQFGTSFFFRNTEPAIAKMISSMCGTETITRQQKNTSFGANEFRDGVSYSEQQQKNQIVEINDLASLKLGECYALFAEPSVRLSKIQTPEAYIKDKNIGFIQRQDREAHFKGLNSVAASQGKQERTMAEDGETANEAVSEVQSSPIKLEADKVAKHSDEKLKPETIENNKSSKISNDFIPKL